LPVAFFPGGLVQIIVAILEISRGYLFGGGHEPGLAPGCAPDRGVRR